MNTCPAAGQPINIVSGAKNQVVEDFSIGRGRLNFVHSYSSFLTDPTRMGRGWASNFHAQYVGNSSAAGYYFNFRLESGEVLRYRKTGGVWKQAGITSNGWRVSSSNDRRDLLGYQLTEPVAKSLILTDPDGMERHFLLDNSWTPETRMTKIRYRDGYEINLAYDTAGSITTATDTDGYQLQFGYDSKYRLASVTAPDGAVYSFEYEEFPGSITLAPASIEGFGWLEFSRLSKVTYPDETPASATDNPFVQYHYEEPGFPAALTGITDERGIRIQTWDYALSGDRLRAISSAGPSGTELTTISETVPNSQYTVTNAVGKQTVYTAATIGKSRKVTSVAGAASPGCLPSNSTNTYNTLGQLTQTVAEEGQTTALTLDTAFDLPTQIVEGSGSPSAIATQLTWYTSLRKPAQITRPGSTTSITYTAGGLPSLITQTDTTTQTVPYSTNGQQRSWAMTWNAHGLLQSINGPLAGTADTVSYTYDLQGNIAATTNEVGHVTTVNSVDPMGRPTQVTEASGRVSAFTYTPRGWLKTVTINPGASARTFTFTYDLAGNLTRIDEPGSRWSEFDYDDAGWVEEARSSAGGKITYQYDLLGNVTRTDFRTTGGASQSHFVSAYDELGRLRSVLGGASDGFEWDYDRSNRMTGETDGLGRTWLSAFDPLDRVLSVTDPETDTEAMEWSPQGGLSEFSDGRSLATTFVRNGFGEVIREVSPDRGTTDYWYDAAGRLTRVLSADGRDVQYAYDASGRLTARTYPNETSLNLSFGYDDQTGGNPGKGRLTSVTGGVSDRTYDYNAFGDVTGESWQIDSQAYDLAYLYAANGDLSRVTYPSGRQVDFSYDGGGRITAVQTRASSGGTLVPVVSGAGYAPYGPLTGYTFGNGVAATLDLDASYRLERLLLTNPGGAILDKTYSYDANSRVTGITDAVTSSATAAYTYHLDGRLRRATGIWGEVEWTYDAVGNRLLEETFSGGAFLGSATYTYPSTSNRLLGSVSDQNVALRSFTHTPDGHISLETRPGSTTDYSYNEAGRLEQIVGNAGLTAEFAYDAFERRVWRNLPQGEGIHHFVFLPDGRLLGEYEGSTGAVVREYVWMDDRLVGSVDAAGTLTYLQTGPLGQPLIAMNGSGLVIWRGELSPFGKLVSSSFGAVPEARFLGQWDEAGSGLYQNWHRTYDASLGRYLEADPIGLAAGQSLYGYAGQDPVNAVDPEGLLSWSKLRSAFGRSGSRYVASGAVAILDTPAPGPADVAGLALAVGTTALLAWDISDALLSPEDNVLEYCPIPIGFPVRQPPLEMTPRCKKQLAVCKDDCANDWIGIPDDGDGGHGNTNMFFRCVRECMERAGCFSGY